MTTSNRFSGKVAFVTGAGSGIGQRIAVGLAEAGADVACFDLPGHPQMADTLARIEALGRRGVGLEGNVVHAADLSRAVVASERALGPTCRNRNASSSRRTRRSGAWPGSTTWSGPRCSWPAKPRPTALASTCSSTVASSAGERVGEFAVTLRRTTQARA